MAHPVVANPHGDGLGAGEHSPAHDLCAPHMMQHRPAAQGVPVISGLPNYAPKLRCHFVLPLCTAMRNNAQSLTYPPTPFVQPGGRPSICHEDKKETMSSTAATNSLQVFHRDALHRQVLRVSRISFTVPRVPPPPPSPAPITLLFSSSAGGRGGRLHELFLVLKMGLLQQRWP